MKKFLKYLTEANDNFKTENDIKFDTMNDMLKKFHMSDLDANKYTVEESNDYFLIISKKYLEKIIEEHKGDIIGSTFSNDIGVYELREIIVDVINEKRPTEIKNNLYKWLGINTGINLGVDNIKKTDNFEKLKKLKDYKIVAKDGNIEKIKIAYEKGKNTKYINIFAKEIGKFEKKPILIIISSYPGKNGINIQKRNEFALYGYYFASKSNKIAKLYDIE